MVELGCELSVWHHTWPRRISHNFLKSRLRVFNRILRTLIMLLIILWLILLMAHQIVMLIWIDVPDLESFRQVRAWTRESSLNHVFRSSMFFQKDT
jgi:hypothetical protein